ncbi:serine/arginine repetitive matrix protein 1 [Drosophila tropicalis]|uniref:serine/arginine repetitive matrix protein 1 n=1 Tax=Drosophila tropicalis TaxID=46794 RepID=UPI0035AB8209
MLGDELDIYDDLDEFQEVEDKKSKELLALEEKYTAAQGEIEGLKAQNNKLTKQIKQMEVNLQNLLDTAKAEIKRKETLIAELRKEKDDICFRRKKAWGVEDTKPNQKRPRYDKTEILESPGPIHKRAKQEETGRNTSGLINTIHERSIENPFAVNSPKTDKTEIHKSLSPRHSRKPSTQHPSSNLVQEKSIEKPVKDSKQQPQNIVSHKSQSPSPIHDRKASPEHRCTDITQEKSINEPAKVTKTAKHSSRSPSPGHNRKPSRQHPSSNVVQEKSINEPAKVTNQKTAKHKSRSPSPGHSRKPSTHHRSSNVVPEKSINEPVKVTNQSVEKTVKHKSRSPSPGHSRKPSTHHRSSNVVQEKTMEKPAKGGNQQADKTIKHKSRSLSPGHSRKSSTQHRFTDSRSRERERQRERDRERGRRHEREVRRSRSPKRSKQDERYRKRVSNDKPNQRRRRSGSRSRQRTASSGTSREQSSNKVKSDTLKTLFGEETNDQDTFSNANTEGIMENESTTQVETLIQPVEPTLRLEMKKSHKTKGELKEINEPLAQFTSLVTSKESKINENYLNHSETGKSKINLDTKPLEETAIPGLNLLRSEDNDKEPISKQQNKAQCDAHFTPETVQLPQIPGLDLLTPANSTTEPNESKLENISASVEKPSLATIDKSEIPGDTNLKHKNESKCKDTEAPKPSLATIVKSEIPGLDLLPLENNEKDSNHKHKNESKLKDTEAPIQELDTHKHSNDIGKNGRIEESVSVSEPNKTEYVKTAHINPDSDKTQKGKEQTNKEIANKPEKKEEVVLPKSKVSKEDSVDHTKQNEKDQKVKPIVSKPERKESLITPEVKIFKEDAVDKKNKETDQSSKGLIAEIEDNESLISPELKISTDTSGDAEKQKDKKQTVCLTESLITPELKVLKENDRKEGKQTIKEIAVKSEEKDVASTESIPELKRIKKEQALSESSKTFIQTLDDSSKKENSEIINVVDMEQKTNSNENALQGTSKGKKGQTIFHAGLITPRRKPLKAGLVFSDDDEPTPKRPTPVKESKHTTPPGKSKDTNPEDQATSKPLTRAIQIIEDIRLPVMMDIEHIAVRVDGVEESVDIPLPPASVKVLPMTKPSTVMYAQPDSTKIDHNENDMVLEAALNVLTAIEESKDAYPPDRDMVEQQFGDISFEFDTLESALEQLHQTSPDESIVTSTSTKANQQPTAKQDLIKILSRSPNYESPIKIPTKLERATEKTPLKKRKINIMENSPIRPTIEPSATPENQDEHHVTIDETMNLSDNANSDSSIVTKRCSLGQSDYQFERINDEVILRVTRRPRRRRPPPSVSAVEIEQN